MFVRFSQGITDETVKEFFISFNRPRPAWRVRFEEFIMKELRISEQAQVAERPLNTGGITNEDSSFPIASREAKQEKARAQPSKMPGLRRIVGRRLKEANLSTGIKHNHLCQKFLIQGFPRRIYTILCKTRRICVRTISVEFRFSKRARKPMQWWNVLYAGDL